MRTLNFSVNRAKLDNFHKYPKLQKQGTTHQEVMRSVLMMRILT